MKLNMLSKTFKHTMSCVVAPSLALGISFAAYADADSDLEPNISIGYHVGVISDYRVRGIAQTSGDPALQGGIDLTTKPGFYVGTAFSNQTWVKELNGSTKGSIEWDVYGGFRAQVADTGFSYDVGVITYQYPGNNSGKNAFASPSGTSNGASGPFFPAGSYSNASTVEAYGDLTYGIYTFKYNRSLGSFLGNLNSSGSQYFDLSAAVAIPYGLTLTPHIGRQLIPGQGGVGDYTDLALTLSKDFGNGFSATLAGLSTNANRPFYSDKSGKYLGNRKITAGVVYSF